MLEPIMVVGKTLTSLHVSLYSYIKPGAPHRYSLDNKPYEYMNLGLGLTDLLWDIARDFQRLSRGEIGLPDIRLGSRIDQALRKSLARYGVLPPLDLVFSIVLSATTIAYGLVKREESVAGYKKALDDVLMASTSRDALEVFESLRRLGYHGEVELLELNGVSRSSIEVHGFKLPDIFSVLESEYVFFQYASPYKKIITEVADAIALEYDSSRSINNAVVRGYVELLLREKLPGEYKDRLRKIVELKLTRTRNGLKELYSLDKDLRGKGLTLEKLVAPLILAVAIASPKLPL